MNTPWRIEMLGWLRAVQGDRVVSRFRTQKTGALLAYLAYYLQRSHPREALIELFWPEMALAAGRNNLSKALTSLRHQLEPPGVPAGAVLVTDNASVRLNPAAVTTDVAAFEAALQAASQAPTDAGRTQRLAEAAALYRGELLPGHTDGWILHERLRLAEAFSGALTELTALLEQAGDLQQALQWARRAIAADPLREEAHHDLIRLLVATHQPEAALRQYQELERLLEGELGVSPSAKIRALIRDVGQRQAGARSDPREAAREAGRGAGEDPAPTREAFPPALAQLVSPATGSLPLQFTRFFGREEEIARLLALLSHPETRLVTLTGPGGSGKTRLALQTAQRLRDTFPVTGWFVPLLDLTDAGLIADKMLDALQLPRSPHIEPLEQVVAFLTRQPSLLVLDNFEHLVHAGAPVVQTLLERAETMTCLVTSRQCLYLPGEREFPVAPLPVPNLPARARARSFFEHEHEQEHEQDLPAVLLQFPSVALFVDRAQAVRPDFQVTAANAAAVAALCARLEGLPLAIELAAARAGVLTVQQMLERLEQRFELLISRKRLADPRHQSLRAALDWSYDLLSPELQRFFARLSVFRGGWTLAAAEAVCEEPRSLWYLEQLREGSLVIAEPVGKEEMRFRLLETLREYGAEQLASGDSEAPGAALARRHAQYFLALAEAAEPRGRTAHEESCLRRLEREHDNLRAALAWSQQHEESDETGLRLAGALGWFWVLRWDLGEGRAWLERALARAQPLGPTPAQAKAFNGAGQLARDQGDFAAARAYFEESVAVCRKLDDPSDLGWALICMAQGERARGDLARARSLLEESLAISQEWGDQVNIAWALNSLGALANERGEYATARSLCGQALTLFQELGNSTGAAWSNLNLADAARRQSDPGAAAAHYRHSLTLFQAPETKRGIACSLEGLAELAGAQGQWERAARLLGASEVLRETLGAPLPPADRAEYDRCLTTTRAALGEAAFAAACAEGRALSLEQVIASGLREALP